MIEGMERISRAGSTGFGQMATTVLAPRRSVIIDMIMVQFISVMITCFGVLIFAGKDMSTSDVTIYMIAIFVSFLFLTSLYSKITR